MLPARLLLARQVYPPVGVLPDKEDQLLIGRTIAIPHGEFHRSVPGIFPEVFRFQRKKPAVRVDLGTVPGEDRGQLVLADTLFGALRGAWP